MDTPRTSTRQRKVQDYSALDKGLDSEKATKQKSGIPVPLKKRGSALSKGLDSTEKATKRKSGIPVRQFEKKQTSSVSATAASTSGVPIAGATPTLTSETNENSPDVDPPSVSTSSASVASTSRVPTQSRDSNATLGDVRQEAAAMANDSVSS